MPNFDKTGPMGQGAMTGRSGGPCNGKGLRLGLGMKGRFCNDLSIDEQEKILKNRLEEIRKLKAE